MMGIWIRKLTAFCLLALAGHAAQCAPLSVLAEKPDRFLSQGSTIQGYCTAVVRNALEAAHLPYQMDIQPWARIYTTTLAKPGTLMYPVARTAEREDKFHWIGPLVANRIALFRKKGRRDVVVHSLDDARRYRIGVVNMDFREAYLRRKGFGEAGSQPLVMGAVPSKLTAVQDATDPSHTSISIQQSSGTFPVNQAFLGGGQLNGLLTFVNKDISQAFNYLGRLGLSLGTQVNTQSHLGLDLNGNPGIDFYSIPALPVGIPATGNAGTAGATMQVANPTQLQASDYQIQFSGPNAGSIVRTSDGATVAQFNSTATPITVDGLSINITGSAAAGDIVTLKPYEAVARNLGVAVSSPQNVAASSPLLVTPTLQPSSGMTVSSAYLTSGSLPTLPATLPTVTMTYSSASGSFTVTDSGGNNLGTIAYVPGQPLTFQENLGGGNVVSYNVNLAGAPANGDVVTLAQGSGTQMNQNSGNAQAMLALRDVPSFNGVGLADGYTTVFSAVASNVQGGKSAAQFSDTAATSAQSALSNVTGVNLDEEASRLMQFQQAYQAAAKFMQTANSTFTTLIQAFS